MPEHLREVEWRDTVGRRWVALLPDHMPDAAAKMGLQKGPVSLEPLGLDLKHEVLLHNELVARHLLTYADVRNDPGAVQGAVRAVWKAGANEIIECFRQAVSD